MNAPDGITPFVGHRFWVLRSADHALTSVCFEDVWSPGTQEAQCHALQDEAVARVVHPGGMALHDIPGELCKCGFWGARERELVAGMLAPEPFVMNRGPVVYGTIDMWGKVIPGKRTYRAAFARIRDLKAVVETFEGLDLPAAVTLLGERYRVPVGLITADLLGLSAPDKTQS